MKRFNNSKLRDFHNEIAIKFQLYNGLFSSLPFHRIENTGVLLAMLLSSCEEGFAHGDSPEQIIEQYFSRQFPNTPEKERMDMLFRFTQYAERQVVLFDAIEDAAFSVVNDEQGPGTMAQLMSEVITEDKEKEFAEKLKDFSVQLVLTAHPTQFYTGSVLGIINDTTRAIKANKVQDINTYLQQLGKTPFLKTEKPTPFDEAQSLIWFLENIFYHAAGQIVNYIDEMIPGSLSIGNQVIKMGFWPGGDRDGNPFVTAPTTLRVADALRTAIIRCYYQDVRKMRRRLTFKGIEPLVIDLEKQLYNQLFNASARTQLSKQTMLAMLQEIKGLILENHKGLFADLVNELMHKINIFGLHFATLDIRQESTEHTLAIRAVYENESILPENFYSLNEDDRLASLAAVYKPADVNLYTDLVKDTLLTMQAIKRIQKNNGIEGCNRYIISQCSTATNVMEVYALLKLSGFTGSEIPVDIVPLFETVEDLEAAASVMEKLYTQPAYAAHLQSRENKQTIMLGFSDGTKDGGYLAANFGIYKAKESLTAISVQYGVNVVFFDGRGGPPSRGGGKTHRFYAGMGQNIANKEIQVTVQGQTISSSFGTIESARFNIEQLLSAGISNKIFSKLGATLQPQEDALMEKLAAVSLEKYKSLKNAPNFMDYLLTVSPMRYYGETNIGSRPAKRGKGKLTLKDLRAIPYVGAWSQIKQNVTGFYGVGTALQTIEKEGLFGDLQQLYQKSLFVRTLFENCEMAMKKCYFPLTRHLENHPEFGVLYKDIFAEFELTVTMILKLNGAQAIMENYPLETMSISMRERVVLPLSTIQQYSIAKIAKLNEDENPELVAKYRKLVVRCSFGIINAARNSV